MSLNLNKPLMVNGYDATILHTFPTGNVAVLVDNHQKIYTYRPSGQPIRGMDAPGLLVNKPTEKVYTLDIYPSTGMIYRRDDRRAQPCQSSYPDMFSVIVTERDGVVVKREFI